LWFVGYDHATGVRYEALQGGCSVGGAVTHETIVSASERTLCHISKSDQYGD
jgi:hypothetical protein